MLEFVAGNDVPMIRFMDAWFQNPTFDQTIDLVPLLAAAPARAWPLWTKDRLGDKGLQDHLIRSLRSWSAFRGPAGQRAEMEKELRRRLPAFIADIQRHAQTWRCLSDVPENEIRPFAKRVEKQMKGFGQAVKGVGKCVLPSKAAHLLLPTLIPAYDETVVGGALRALLRGSASMSRYLIIAWWALQRLRDQGNLQAARNRVAECMLSHWFVRTLRPPALPKDHTLLRSLDSVVAEYTVIQMERTNAKLRWT
jgi:hypothetical protein